MFRVSISPHILLLYIISILCGYSGRTCANKHSEVNVELIGLGCGNSSWKIPKDCLDASSNCYCFGADEDISFEAALIKHVGATVYLYDPSPEAIRHINCIRQRTSRTDYEYILDQIDLGKLIFHPVGIGNEDSYLKLYASIKKRKLPYSVLNNGIGDYIEVPCKKLSTIMKELELDSLDLLKLDIEGAENVVLLNMLEEEIYPKVLCVKFRHIESYDQQQLLRRLTEVGYATFSIVDNQNYTFIYDDPILDACLAEHAKKGYSLHDSGRMKIYEYAIDCFARECIKTEYTAYTLFKEKPLNCEANYLAVPWSVLINSRQLGKVPQIKLDGGFTICQHILFEQIIPKLREIGIDTLFTPHATKSKKYKGLMVLPFPHLAVNAPMPAPEKDLWYSFIGANTHKTRSIIFNMPQPDHVVIKKRDRWHFDATQERKNRDAQEYKDVLARSRFSLCPRGTGPGSIRFWESLCAGAIPISIADDLALPDGFDWKLCIIQVPENEVNKIGEILNKITLDKEEQMRKNVLSYFSHFSGENFVQVVRAYYQECAFLILYEEKIMGAED